jgi:hypothetical protein
MGCCERNCVTELFRKLCILDTRKLGARHVWGRKEITSGALCWIKLCDGEVIIPLRLAILENEQYFCCCVTRFGALWVRVAYISEFPK